MTSSFVSKYETRTRPNSTSPWTNWNLGYSASFNTDITKEEKHGASTPRHNKLINQGTILPVNPYHVSTEFVARGRNPGIAIVSRGSASDGYFTSEERLTDWYDFSSSDEAFQRVDVNPTIDPALINQAVNEAISSATQSLVMAPVTALEARETLHMLKNAVRRLLNFASFIRDLAARKRESFSSLWLEYRLGWTPFYYELIGFINIMNGKLKVGERQHGSGLRGIPVTDSKTWSAPVRGWAVTNFESVTISATVRGFALAEVTDSTLARYGLNPVLVAWESITLSWLLDKFVSVGSWLSTLSGGMSGFNLVSSGRSVKITLEATKIRSNVPVPEDSSRICSGQSTVFSYTRRLRSFDRSPDSGGGWPGINRHYSAVSITDVLALIAQWYGHRS